MASAYWEHRAELRQLAYDRANNKVVADVSRVYDRTMRQLNEDIDSIIGTYQRKTGLTTREAYDFLNQGVPPGVMDELRSRVAVITEPKQRKRLQVMLSTDAYRARISRLDAIKASTRVGLTEAAEAELQAITPHLNGMIESGYSRTLYDIQRVSYGFAGAGVPRSALDMILKSRWSGEHYSSRIWGNRDAMASILNRALMEQSTMGKLSDLTMQDVRGMVNLDKWRSQLTSKFKDEAQYAKYAANRLIRTESAYVANQATALAYEECEIEKYEYISVLDSRTSKKCSGLDGQIFKVSEKEVGVNFPPAHAHCRSGVAPVLDTQNRKTMQRRAEGKDGQSVTVPRDMNYNEWKAWQDAGCPDVEEWRAARVPKPVVQLDKNSSLGVKLGEEHYGKITELANNAPETPRSVWAKQQRNVEVADAQYNGKQAYNDQGGIHLNIKKDALGNSFKMPYGDTFHEGWHNIDHRLGSYGKPLSANGTFGETLKADFNRLIESRRMPTSTGRIPTRKEAIKSLSREFMGMNDKEFGALKDILEGVSGGEFETLVGHGKDFWTRRFSIETETFANLGEMSMTNPKGYEMFQKMFSDSHKTWIEMLKGVL